MAEVEKELEKQLMEAGDKLLSPPSSVSELLSLLNRIENFLTGVEQSPSESMNKALSPSRKALIADNLLNHPNVDVKVAVASCISEITRITAPDAPYGDDQMKEVFKLIVSSFEKLDDNSSPSFTKRSTILETVAKVRSCVVMLDLECDSLILEMFQHFLRSIRDYHPEHVFSSMETIMTLILDESEEVSLELVSSMLDFLKIENKEVLPIARQLAEKVIEKCASKVESSIIQALRSQGSSLNEYSEVVANVCLKASEVVEPSEGDAVSKNMVGESDLGIVPTEKVAMETIDVAPPLQELCPIAAVFSKSDVSNGIIQKEMEENSAGTDSTKEVNHENHDGFTGDALPSEADVNKLDDEENIKLPAKTKTSNRRKGRKTSVLKSSSKTSESRVIDDRKGTDKMADKQEKSAEDVDSAPSDAVADCAGPIENILVTNDPVSSTKISENEIKAVDVPSLSPSGSLATQSDSKKVEQEKNDNLVQESVPVNNINSEKESHSKKASEGTDVSEFNTHNRTDKKASSELDEDHSSSPLNTSKKEDENNCNLNVRSAKQFEKNVEAVSVKSHDKKNRGPGKVASSNDLIRTPSKDEEEKPVLKSTEKSKTGGIDGGKSSKSSRKRKWSLGKGKASKTKGYGEELVGSKIQVWWPADKKFYQGFVESFDSTIMKHKVVYDDGDEETLKLANEKWRLVLEDSKPEKKHANDNESPDEASETPKGKKAKNSEDTQAQGGKAEVSVKKGGASTSKSKATPNSSGKQKDGHKIDDKSKEMSSKSSAKSDQDKGGRPDASKAGNKSSDNTPKSTGKSKDENLEASKATNKSKKDTPKGAAKSKGIPLVTTSKAKSGSPEKGKEIEDEEKLPKPSKTPEKTKGKSPSASKSQKSGMKRKRSGRS